ncbi:MAG: hypothetical protein QXS20_01455 [Candidatus Thorarchaeota archaeon]
MVPLQLMVALTGVLLVVRTLFRARRLSRTSKLKHLLESRIDVSRVDTSGNGEYVRCLSHQWMIDRTVYRYEGRFTAKILGLLRDRTFVSFLAIGLMLGWSAMILGALMVDAISLMGGGLLFLVVGGLVALGPDEARLCEEYLDDLNTVAIERLNEEDYVYLVLAIRQVRKWTLSSALIGMVMIAMAPYADSILPALSVLLSSVVVLIVVGPALALLDLSVILSVVYIAVLTPLIFLLLPYWTLRRLRHHDGDESVAAERTQW